MPTGTGDSQTDQSYDWAALDQAVASIQEVGLSADLIVDGCPPWAAVSGAQGSVCTTSFPCRICQLGSRRRNKIRHQRRQVLRDLERAEHPAFWQPKPDPAAYTADLKAAYAAIKAVDPSAVVLSGGLAPEPRQLNDL